MTRRMCRLAVSSVLAAAAFTGAPPGDAGGVFLGISLARAERVLGELPGHGKSIVAVRFRGNRKAEDDAIRINLQSLPGTPLDAERLREDLRAIWKMGFFEDVQVESTEEPGEKVSLT